MNTGFLYGKVTERGRLEDPKKREDNIIIVHQEVGYGHGLD